MVFFVKEKITLNIIKKKALNRTFGRRKYQRNPSHFARHEIGFNITD